MKLEDPTPSLVVDSVVELQAHVGSEIGVSGWACLEEADVLGFAELTHDRHWIHTDSERARTEAGLDGLLAHGFLVLSVVTALANQCYTVRKATRWTNYGLERVRFTAPVFPGVEFRLRLTLDAVAPGPTVTTRLDLGCLLERRASERPALAANWIVLVEGA